MITFSSKSNILFSLLLGLVFISSCKKDDETGIKPEGSTFCYSVTVQGETYSDIIDGKDLDINSDDFYEIDLGFKFNFCGTEFDKLFFGFDYGPTFSYEISGDITDATGFELLPFGALFIDQTSNDLQYKIEGDDGDRIVIVEWNNFEFGVGQQDPYRVNFQMRLFEKTNEIYFHYGANNVDSTEFKSNQFYFLPIGLYSTNGTDGLYLSGKTDDPKVIKSPTVGLDTWPLDGTLYIFK